MARQRWPRSPRAARALQERLRARVAAEDHLAPVRRVAGVDAAHGPQSGLTCAAAALLDLPALGLCASALACRATGFPYVPGLLSFRETPAILEALRRLPAAPDLILVDGQGRAHPRRFGIACHIGVLTDTPTIGVAKSRLVGTFEPPGPARGQWSPLWDGGEVIGAALTTRRGTRPVFVSVGHRVSLETAIALVLRCAPRYRLPEPIRQADRLSRRPGAAAARAG